MDLNTPQSSPSERKEPRRLAPPPIRLKAGALLFREGDISREAYQVSEGTLVALRRSAAGAIEAGRFHVGDLIGETSQIDGLPRCSTVQALCDCTLLVIPAQTYVVLLQQSPPWLGAAFRQFIIQLRQEAARVNASSTPSSLEALAQFLVLKCRPLPYSAPSLELLDEFVLLTRIPHEQSRKSLQILVTKGLAHLDAKQFLTLQNSESLDILRFALFSKRKGYPLDILHLDPTLVHCLNSLPRIIPKGGISTSFLLELWTDSRTAVQSSHIDILIQLGALHPDAEQGLRLDRDRCAWLLKAQQQANLFTDLGI